MSGLTIASKSPWHPAMRREHHFSLVASRYGYDVTFIEQPEDIRSARSHLKHYVEGLRGRVSEESSIKVMQRSVLVPGHRGKLWQHLDVWQLHRLLESTINPVVHYLPWQFGAGPSTARAVFDCTDNWLSLYPSAAAPLLQRSFAKIADEADEIIVVSPALSSLFPGREPQVIPNVSMLERLPTWWHQDPASKGWFSLAPCLNVLMWQQSVHFLPICLIGLWIFMGLADLPVLVTSQALSFGVFLKRREGEYHFVVSCQSMRFHGCSIKQMFS